MKLKNGQTLEMIWETITSKIEHVEPFSNIKQWFAYAHTWHNLKLNNFIWKQTKNKRNILLEEWFIFGECEKIEKCNLKKIKYKNISKETLSVFKILISLLT